MYIIFRTTNQLLARMIEQCLRGGILRSLTTMIIIFFVTGLSVSIRVVIIWAISFMSITTLILEKIFIFSLLLRENLNFSGQAPEQSCSLACPWTFLPYIPPLLWRKAYKLSFGKCSNFWDAKIPSIDLLWKIYAFVFGNMDVMRSAIISIIHKAKNTQGHLMDWLIESMPLVSAPNIVFSLHGLLLFC